VDYAIYGIIHSACGAHRKPAAIHRYVPPGCIRNGVTLLAHRHERTGYQAGLRTDRPDLCGAR
jgi:hypothetical protein